MSQPPPETIRADFVRPEFAGRLTNLFRVAVLPPRADITRMSFWRTKTARSGETTAMADRLKGLVEQQLRQLGFAVEPLPASFSQAVPMLDSTNEVANSLARLKRWMDIVPWGTSRFTVGDEDNPGAPAEVLAQAAGVDAIVCVKFWSVETTLARRLRAYHATAAGVVGAGVGVGGVLAAIYFSHGSIPGDEIAALALVAGAGGFIIFREVAWWITGGGTYEDSVAKRATLQIAIVDGVTGEVLWANTDTANAVAHDIDPLAARLFFNFPR